MSNTNEDGLPKLEIGGNISLSTRMAVKDFDKKGAAEMNRIKTTVNNRAQYLKRQHGWEFEVNLVDALTSDRKYIVMTFIATRVK